MSAPGFSSQGQILMFWRTLSLVLLVGSLCVTGQTSSASSSSSSSVSDVASQAAFPGLTAATNWEFGQCPLVVASADFNGNDYTHTSEPDIASCCATCSASVQAFQGKYGANASPDGIVCLAWTYNPANKLCFLKNSVMKGSSTSLIAVPGVYTGSYESQFPPLKATYNTFVADYLQAVQTISSVSSVATATNGENVQVATTCSDFSCQKIAAIIK